MPSLRKIQILNSLSKKKEPFESLEPGVVRFYSCGPTVYNLIHVGNLRSALVADLVVRVFRRFGYDVKYVRNYTDIDDKIIHKAQELNTSSQNIAAKYIQEVELDYKVCGLLEPLHKTLATHHVGEMIEMINSLIRLGYAYIAQGEVLFSIKNFTRYGHLSHRSIDDLKSQDRASVRDYKKDPFDFTLWKPSKKGEPQFESPWGLGRPGWHIECSAMVQKWLGDQIDLHHGGEDLMFPHHENEIAQSEAATGKTPFSKYWIHHAFVVMGDDKMSKSQGNVVLARDFLTQYGAELTRFWLLSSHYRSKVYCTDQSIQNAVQGLDRIYECKKRALQISKQKNKLPDGIAEQEWTSFLMDFDIAKRKYDDALANDFDTPEALAALFGVIREFNRIQALPRADSTASGILAAEQLYHFIHSDVGGVFGFGIRDSLPDSLLKKNDLSGLTDQEIEAQISKRALAKKDKNFEQADQIRKDLESHGVLLKDSPHGTSWKRKTH